MDAANLVDIVGAGQGPDGTVLRPQTPSSSLVLDVRSASSVSNLRVRVENQPGIFESGVALGGVGTVGDGITVRGEPGVANATGVIVRTGAILRNSLVQVPPTSNANKAITAEDGARIENVAAAGDVMLDARNLGPPVVVRRLRSPTRLIRGYALSARARWTSQMRSSASPGEPPAPAWRPRPRPAPPPLSSLAT